MVEFFKGITPAMVVILFTPFSGCQSNEEDLGKPVVKSPTITSFTPTSGVVGTVVIVTGTNFDVDLAKNVLKFNGTLATITAVTTTSITTTVPSGTVTGPLTITVNAQSVTSSGSFTIIAEPTILTVTPSTAHVGDTVVVAGENLDKILPWELSFDDKFGEILTQEKNKIVAIIPGVNHEHIQVKVREKSIPLDIVGVFPLNGNQIGYDILGIQAFTDKMFFVSASNGLFKTVDGGYTWVKIDPLAQSFQSAFFLDENHGWVGVSDGLQTRLYYTSDGGVTYTMKHADKYFFGSITHIVFSDVNNGYFTTSSGDIFYSDNNDAILVYDNPPNSDDINFINLSLLNGTLIALGNRKDFPIMIKGKNNVLSETDLSTEYITDVQVISETQMYLVGQYSLYISTNGGDVWTKVGTEKLYRVFFMDEKNGLAVIPESFQLFDHLHIFKTTDGGVSWKLYYKMGRYEYSNMIAIKEKAGLIAGQGGRIWKYVKE